MKKYGILALLAIMVVGCATAYGPRYQAARSAGDVGYYDTRIDENRYRVEYRTDVRDTALAQDFAMRRAAELTLNNNYDWFQVISRNRAITDDMFGRYDQYRYNNDGPRDRPGYYDNNRYNDDAVASVEVLMGYNPAPRGASTYDARRILDYLRSANYDNRGYNNGYNDRRY